MLQAVTITHVFVLAVALDVDARSGNLIPCTIPVITSPTSVPNASRRADRESSGRAGTVNQLGTSGTSSLIGLPLVDTLHAVPRTRGYAIEANAVGMVCRIAAIAEEENVLSVGKIAYGAGDALFLFFGVIVIAVGVLSRPAMGVELGNLFLIFDFVGRNKLAWHEQLLAYGSLVFVRGRPRYGGKLTSDAVVDEDFVEDGAA